MAISEKCELALRNYVTKLQKRIDDYQPGCWAKLFGSNKITLWQNKIDAMQHVLEKNGYVKTTDLDEQFPGWSDGTGWSNTENKINAAISSSKIQGTNTAGKYYDNPNAQGNVTITNGFL